MGYWLRKTGLILRAPSQDKRFVGCLWEGSYHWKITPFSPDAPGHLRAVPLPLMEKDSTQPVRSENEKGGSCPPSVRRVLQIFHEEIGIFFGSGFSVFTRGMVTVSTPLENFAVISSPRASSGSERTRWNDP